jgi:hypothetical protein
VKQVYPASITGKGAVAGGSVLDHKFGQSDPYTLGVEEEYMLLDGETFDLVQHIDTVLQAITGHELEQRINAELMQSVLEIATPVCRTAADVQRELLKLRAYVSGIGREKGMRVGSASVAFAISSTTSTMSRFALKTRSWRSAPLPRPRISPIPSSSRSEPSSFA